MFKEIFNVSGSLYYLDPKNFIEGKTTWSAEVISEEDELVIKEEKIDNIYNKLIELNDKNELELYLYPNRPDFIPLDNSDLIPKVINWTKNGFNINKFYYIYPELKSRVEELLKDKN